MVEQLHLAIIAAQTELQFFWLVAVLMVVVSPFVIWYGARNL